MEKKFTPGPWVINHWDTQESGISLVSSTNGINYYQGDAISEKYYGIRSKISPYDHHIMASFEGAHIAYLTDFTHQDEGIESKANAYLIAAAPELLEALEDLVERADRARAILQTPDSGSHHGYWGMLDTENAKLILKKAYGEQ